MLINPAANNETLELGQWFYIHIYVRDELFVVSLVVELAIDCEFNLFSRPDGIQSFRRD